MTDVKARKRRIAARFGARAERYDAHAGLQRDVADKLAGHLPEFDAPRLLEVGCGTGFLTAHLVKRYGRGECLVTDIAPEMVSTCERRFEGSASFRVMDAEAPDCDGPFDLIATSMTVQWFSDPVAGVRRLSKLLSPDGVLIYATLGPGSFPEWRDALATEGLAAGTAAMPSLPGVIEEEKRQISYETGHDFLATMKAIGASEARAGYTPHSPGALRRALRRLEQDHGARVSWHIVYGRLDGPHG